VNPESDAKSNEDMPFSEASLDVRAEPVDRKLHGAIRALDDAVETLNVYKLEGLSLDAYVSRDLIKSIARSMAPRLETMGLSESMSRIVDNATRTMAALPVPYESPFDNWIPASVVETFIQHVSLPAIDASAWVPKLSGLPGLMPFTNDLLSSDFYRSFLPQLPMPDLSSIFSFPSLLQGLDIDSLIQGLRSEHVPPNWLDVELDPDEAESQVRAILEDGIPLGWVPDALVIQRLLGAPDRATRRRVLGNNWKGILNLCERVVEELPQPRAFFLADMTRTAIRAIRDGHPEAGQALATNVLDTTVSQYSAPELQLNKGSILDPERQDWLIGHGWRIGLSLVAVNASMAGKYGLDHRGTAFHRNVTAHAANRRQYNRINAVIAVMLATSTLACYVRDTSAFD